MLFLLRTRDNIVAMITATGILPPPPPSSSAAAASAYTFSFFLLLLLYGSSAIRILTDFSVSLIFYTVCRTPWTWDQPVTRHLPTHRTNAHTDTHALSGIRSHDPSVRASEDSSCLRSRGHCDRPRSELLRLR
jgi:hypothetical protein